ncbi:Hsp20 family protein [Thermanaerosceptrum fracticalcis]|uniref:Hsp20 family protein n=1 Tax=Thermanaerosceptrum fracticalcis TaxID=1712410 RepID=A0A7G6E0K9_THEFR|nr:Hsp20/alpha crystallin family protein [Thermanaerosceptrum fracticalcis]QNB45613.1 Hsp20 family protein [Thermanaerosceptrum fracticalcis]
MFNLVHRNLFSPFSLLNDDFFTLPMTVFSKTITPNTFKVDIQEKETAYQLNAELAGYDKGDLEVKVQNGTVTIKAEKKEEINEDKGNYIHRETSYGSVTRQFYLGTNLDEANAEAKYENGILSIIIPKKTKTDKTIEIK